MKRMFLAAVLLMALLLSGCQMRTVDQMYAVPRRSAEYEELQKAIDSVIADLSYCAPLSGENRQSVQMADLNGDGEEEYLLFAKGNSDDPLKIFIFMKNGARYDLMQTIESRGSGFEQVEYVDIDGTAGKELVVGRQVSDQVLRYLTVYSFRGTKAERLLAVNYVRFVVSDLNEDDRSDLVIISTGESEAESGSAALYHFENDAMVRSREAMLSAKSENIKRIMVSRLHGGRSAVYVASSMDESAIITDVFSMCEGRFTNVSLSNESGTSVQTLRNHYIYADDIDSDGTLELPDLMEMRQVQNNTRSSEQHLIRWYAMTEQGNEVDKMHTFHNFDGGWYLTLDEGWASRISVTQQGNVCTFYVWDESFEKAEKLLSVYTMTGSDRELEAEENNRAILYKTEGVVYAAKLEVAALSYGLSEENLAGSFHLIQMDWKNGET